MSVELVQASARELPLADASVQCVVTSPPYWGLRKYAGEQELIWGGKPECAHEWEERQRAGISGGQNQGNKAENPNGATNRPVEATTYGMCGKCGAWRGAYGLEPNVEMYVQHTVEILREIKRVLRADGVCFWNIGDSYANDTKWGGKSGAKNYTSAAGGYQGQRQRRNTGMKPKDLCLIPARVALAAQADGWWVRADIIWAKPNPMPESVRDRPTEAYEHILMLSKSAKYYWDAEAVKEASEMRPQNRFTRRADHPKGDEGRLLHRRPEGGGWQAFGYTPKGTHSKGKKLLPPCQTSEKAEYANGGRAFQNWHATTSEILSSRNMRNVWMFATQPYKGAHFATFPEELPRRCIKAATRPGDLVLDPFAGSGTVGKVAAELGRRAILVDLAYAPGGYLELARQRIYGVQLSLQAA